MIKKMKKYISFLLLAVVMFSCSKDFLEEKTHGLLKPSIYFTSVSDLEKCINALYCCGNLMYNETATLVACMGGDDVTTHSGKAYYLAYDVFSAEDNNLLTPLMWGADYGVIKQANTIINNIDKFVEPVDQPTFLKNQKDRGLGQAYFMRALAYFNLVRIYGEVPIILEVPVNYKATKASFQEIYELIISDLTKAETLVPDDYRTAPDASDLEKQSYYARANTGAVKALMASVYLNWAGYPLKDNSKYALAAQKAKEIIDNEASYGYTLLANYGDLWKPENNINSETIFGIYLNDQGNWVDIGTWANGNALTPGFMPGNFGGWDDLFAEINFFNEFPEGPRKEATFLVRGQAWSTEPVITWHDFSYSHPYYKKYMFVPGFDTTNMAAYINWWSDRSVQVIRYAEVLLVYAEAKAMSDGPDALAYTCVNWVRNRAGLSDIPAGLSATDFCNAVIDERKWEFAGNEPCARWFDMVRTETVESATAKRDPSEISLKNQPSAERYFSPIPHGDKLLNPNL
jgi:hypothetical protein